MRRGSRRLFVGGALGTVASAAAVYALVLRPWHLRWGATRDEIERKLPFDGIVPDPNYFTTRAITIDAPPEAVWPWLVQMGELPRAGFYSYEWVETLLGRKVVNSREILPEHQSLEPGDRLDRAGLMVVRAVQEPKVLVLTRPEGVPDGEMTWTIVLEPADGGSKTRLISRCRANFPPSARSFAWYALLDPGQFVMERAWLLGIKARAEGRRR